MNNILLRINSRKAILPCNKRMFVHFNYPCRVGNCVNKSINAKVNFKNIIQRNITNTANVDNKISSNRKKRIYMLSILISSILGYGAFKWDEKKKISNFLNEMTEISDEVFDRIDNIVLFVIDKNKLSDEKKKVQFLKHEIEKLNIKNLNYLYTFHEESRDFACYIYKGRRRRNITKEELVDTSSIKEIFEQFFVPISEDSEKLNEGNNGTFPTYVTHDTFEKEVIEDSKKNDILLVLFENTCFLCFLYKPFINSLYKLFKENNIELKLKKYNIEKNDYAPNMIVSRGTPTFLFYTKGKGTKLDEYKPNEIIEKIDKMVKLPSDLKEEIIDKVESIHARMHQFGLLTMWTTESKVIENTLIKRHIKDIPNSTDDESIYNEVLTALIEEDSQRNDLIEDSLNFINEKIKEAEKGCYVAALMMANELIDEEKKII
ncbi:conserved Plasmodium protein, unknown function [Plasmodium chabaudi chabaudi]|uniref:Thioredoxin domain-containing protein n=1 Tax=Plasmodium chabaudi chabaudi TaxID=31271 RepID=A0A1C6Y9S5_PLACU|nr:conserved Plasmodium protein, unknown function [Plasmodium chabaudi chabaudi]